MNIHIPGLRTFFFGRYGSLLSALVLIMVLQILVSTKGGRYALELLLILVLLAGLRAIKVNKWIFLLGIGLLALSIIFSLIAVHYSNVLFLTQGVALRALFLIVIALSILLDLFKGDKVTGDTLAGAVCLYLLIALIWAYLFFIVEFLSPGSFSFTESEFISNLWLSHELYNFLYFSLVTMTTVGYGDMAPLSNGARTLATIEAIVGQVYLTILVARLVGLYLLDQKKA